jgi:hypothetical protein
VAHPRHRAIVLSMPRAATAMPYMAAMVKLT